MARSRFSLWWAVLGAAAFLAIDALRRRASATVSSGTQFKEGVTPAALSAEMLRALPVIEQVHRSLGLRAPIVTSTTESHVTGLHPRGLAVDLRTRDLQPLQISALVIELRRALGTDYDVIDESRTSQPHIHVEYDPD